MLIMNNGAKALQDIKAGALLDDCQPIARGLIQEVNGQLISDSIFSNDQ